MKTSKLSLLALLPLLLVQIYAVMESQTWLSSLSGLLLFFPLLHGFCCEVKKSRLNFRAFVITAVLAGIFGFFQHKIGHFGMMVFSGISYLFLYLEALKFTERSAANRYIKIVFVILVILNVYFLVGHLEELKRKISDMGEMIFYVFYYLNLLVMALIALVYYLNSYSKKSVYFISLTLALLFADVFRDMALFYLPDASVEIIQSILRMAGLFMAFKFFTTSEKKLRLINLV